MPRLRIADSGTRINADLSAALLNTIFWPNSPLHDLGVVISQGKVAFAGVQFPVAEEGTLERELGSRHRAAVGLSNESDAVVIVVGVVRADLDGEGADEGGDRPPHLRQFVRPRLRGGLAADGRHLPV